MVRKVPEAAIIMAISRVMERVGGYAFVVLLPVAVAMGQKAAVATVPPILLSVLAYGCGVYGRTLAEDLLRK